MTGPSIDRADYCAIAIAEAFRGDGERLISPIGLLPMLGARLAKLTFAPGLLLTDGVASLLATCPPIAAPATQDAIVEGWLPYRSVFDMVWSGRRHVMMGATQIDQYGNQNIACIGDPRRPKAQLLGMRGAPGNTLCHPTSYFIPNHSPKVFVRNVDVVSGVGYDRARALGSSARFHEIRCVISNLGVFDFNTPDRRMRVAALHPGVTLRAVTEQTGFELAVEASVPETRSPSADELVLLRKLDPERLAAKELRA
jgi:acyl CoA:acetate/3-ketoacid CoA transferase beta subunit